MCRPGGHHSQCPVTSINEPVTSVNEPVTDVNSTVIDSEHGFSDPHDESFVAQATSNEHNMGSNSMTNEIDIYQQPVNNQWLKSTTA